MVKQIYRDHHNVVYERQVDYLNVLPPFILRNGTLFQLASNGCQHFTRIICKVQIPHLCWRNWYNGESFLVFFNCRCSNLEKSNAINI